MLDNEKIKLCLATIVVVFLECVLCQNEPFPYPNSEDRGKDYWREQGKADIEKQLKIEKLNKNIAKNVILFIGDGLGVPTHTAARIYKGQKQGHSGEESKLAWEEHFPYTGQSKTYNTDRQVPDSAGTATAIFSGVKTRMGVLGIDSLPEYRKCDPDLVEKSKLKSLLHHAYENGKSTGIITDCRITHATPAALYAHTQDRKWESDSEEVFQPFRNKGCHDIAWQLVHNASRKINLIFGGGRANFQTNKTYEDGNRLEGDLIEEWKQNTGGQVFLNKADLESWNPEDDDESKYALGLFSKSHLKYVDERNNKTTPDLELMITKALKKLKKNENGFFLMVEGGKIDKAHHESWAHRAFEETLELEKAVLVALNETSQEDTLMVLTGDHSHGITINGYPKRGQNILGPVPIEEKGVGDGISNLYIESKSGKKLPWSIISYTNGKGFREHFTENVTQLWRNISAMNWKTDFKYRYPAMINTSLVKELHAGEDVPILARGPYAHLFTGVHEQSYIAHAIEYAAGWTDAENITQLQALAIAAGTTRLQSLMTMTFFAFIMIIFI